MKESWKELPINPRYEISNLGNVRKKIFRRKPYRVLKCELTTLGYKRVCIVIENNRYKRFLVHRLVAEAFIPNTDNLPFVNHIDSNPINNAVDNLEWCTPGYNLSHSYKSMRRSAKGSKNNLAKLDESDILTIRNIDSKSGLFHRQIAEKYGVSQPLITMIINKTIWTHI